MSAEPPAPFGVLLKRYRRAAGVSQEELAERARVGVHTISDLERGVHRVPHRDTLRQLADALELSRQDRARLEVARRPESVFSGARGSAASPQREDGIHRAMVCPLVGRRQELALVDDHLMKDGPPLLVMSGEPGIGKSRLLQEGANTAIGYGFTVLEGGCQRRSGQEPYAPIVDALANLLRRLSTPQIRSALRDARWLVGLLPELADTIGDVPTLPTEPERRLVFHAVGRFLGNVAGSGGTLLLLDDLQWAGLDAIDLLDGLARSASASTVPLRIIGTYRDTEVGPQDPLATMLADLAHAQLVRQVTIHPLTSHEATELFKSVLAGSQEVGGEVERRIVQRTGGVPFFLISCAHALRTRLPGESEPDVPWDVAQGIRQRVAIQTDSTQEVLRAAAIVGRQIPYTLLVAAVTRPEGEIMEALEAAQWAQLLEEEGDSTYRFVHDVIREVIEGDLGAARRTHLHRRIAEAMETLPERAHQGRAAEIAWHFQQGDDLERGLRWSIAAGDEAERVFAHGEAEDHYRTARELAGRLDDATREAEAFEKLGWVVRNAGRYEEALELLEHAVRLYSREGDAEAELRTLVRIGRTHWLRGSVLEGIGRLEPLLAAHSDEVASIGLAQLHMVLAYLYFPAGRYDEELAASARAAQMARDLSANDVAAHADLLHGVALLMVGQPRAGLRVVKEGMSAAEAAQDIEALTHLTYNAGIIHRLLGETNEAHRTADGALRLASRAGDPFMTGVALHGLGMLAFNLGEWDEARSRFEQSIDVLRAIGSWHLAYPLCQLGALSLAQGRWRDMTTYLTDAATIAQRSGDRQAVRVIEELYAERDLLLGRPVEALVRLKSFLDIPEWTEVDVTALTPLLSLVAWAHLEAGEVNNAEDYALRAVHGARGMEDKPALLAALRTQGMILGRSGHHDAAEEALDEAIRVARQGPYPYAEGRALHAYGILLSEHSTTDDTARARSSLESALSIFERLKAGPYTERTNCALEGLEHRWTEGTR